MKTITNPKKIKEVLERGVEEIIEKESLVKKLQSGRSLKIKHGIDPTGPKIHIGRASQFWKLKALQDLGHQIVLIIGDFTAQIGDASDKTSMRRAPIEKEVKENMKTYESQIAKILDMKKVEVHRNSEWFNNLKLKEILQLSMKFTAQQMIQRRNFKERWNMGKPIGVHELSYPILQGYDSKMVKADVEVGGSDQLFNLKVGREIQKIFGQKPQEIMTLKMLYGLDGRKMSTSWGNVVNISDSPKQIYGKVMSMRDELIGDYFELCTKVSMETAELIKEFIKRKIKGEIEKFKQVKKELGIEKLDSRTLKARLAKEIVKLYHGERKALLAEKEFNRVFREKKLPSKIPNFKTSKKVLPILDLIFESGLASSKSQAKRLILERGVKIDGKVKTNWQEKIKLREGMILRVGKRKFVRVKT